MGASPPISPKYRICPHSPPSKGGAQESRSSPVRAPVMKGDQGMVRSVLLLDGVGLNVEGRVDAVGRLVVLKIDIRANAVGVRNVFVLWRARVIR